MKSFTTLSPACATPSPSSPTRFTPTQNARFSMARARSSVDPGEATRGRPVGGVDHDVVFELRAAPAPHRKPQVVTDERAQPRAAPLDDERVLAGAVVPVFAAHAEQVALVVPVGEPTGQRDHEAVVDTGRRRCTATLPPTAASSASRLREQPGARFAVRRPPRALSGFIVKPVVNISGSTTRSVVARERRQHLLRSARDWRPRPARRAAAERRSRGNSCSDSPARPPECTR